jgi:hypothetical protein
MDKIWRSVVDGPYNPTVAGTGGTLIPKPLANYSEDDFKRMDTDSAALTLLKMAIPNHILRKVKTAKSAKELWTSLKLMFMGSVEAKEHKRDILKAKYENFRYIQGESMSEQIFRYIEIIDSLE